MKKTYFIILVFLMGCASTAALNDRFARVNYSDGIDRVEAKSIAQQLLMGLGLMSDYAISAPQFDTEAFSSYPEWKGRAWVICFSSKSLNLLDSYNRPRFVVGVDKNNGNIRFYQYGPRLVPAEMRSFAEGGIPLADLVTIAP